MEAKNKQVATFLKRISSAQTEEHVLTRYQRLLEVKDWPRPFGCDGLVNETLFEFKLDRSMARGGVSVLAQACYYLRRIRNIGVYKGVQYTAPSRVAVCDINEAFVVDASRLIPYVAADYEWDRPPSSPDPKLVDALRAIRLFVHDMTSEEGVVGFLADVASIGSGFSQLIGVDNFALVFQVWKANFAQALGPQQAAHAFLLDIQQSGVFLSADAGKVLFRDGGASYELNVSVEAYRRFWEAYELPPDNAELQRILERKDQLVAMQHRRETGEFFTPADLSALAHQYVLSINPYAYDGLWWDCCAGSGNLTLDCPDMAGRLFISTLHNEDAETIRASGQNHDATVFAYDFLNPVDGTLPPDLLAALTPGSKWTMLINPPFAAGTDLESSLGKAGGVKTGVSSTMLGAAMSRERLGHACQNLYAQFLYGILKMIEEKQIGMTLGVFSVAAWLGGTGFRKFRELWLSRFEFRGGLTVQCSEFHGAKGAWPVTFTTWSSR
jgi:hypothetical protein